jgi:hypothetical protein
MTRGQRRIFADREAAARAAFEREARRVRLALGSLPARARGTPAKRAALRAELGAAQAAKRRELDTVRAQRRAQLDADRELRQERAKRKSPSRARASRRKAERQWEAVQQSCATAPPVLVKPCRRGGWALGAKARRSRREPVQLFLEDLERNEGVHLAWDDGIAHVVGGGTNFHAAELHPSDDDGDALLEREWAAQAEELGYVYTPPARTAKNKLKTRSIRL